MNSSGNRIKTQTPRLEDGHGAESMPSCLILTALSVVSFSLGRLFLDAADTE